MKKIEQLFIFLVLLFPVAIFFYIKSLLVQPPKEVKQTIPVFTITAKYNFEPKTFEELIEFYCEKYEVSVELINAIAHVETRKRNLIGDKHLQNKAYGYFQLRQPAIDQVNKIYKIDKVKLAEEIFDNIEHQVEYAVLFVKYLYKVTNNEKEAISAYNIGIGNVKKGKFGNYYNKIKKVMNGELLD